MGEVVSENAVLQPGTRIFFVRDIIEPACGDHPTLILAEKNTNGTVVGHSPTWGHSVTWDSWPAAFGAKLGEDFVVIPRVLP